MTIRKATVVASAIIALSAVVALGGTMPNADTRPNPAFDKMKSLVGTWEGKTADGKPVSISYSLISNGSAVMEQLTPGGEPTMVTVYYPDGARLMMTHYCSMHNQPRMETGPVAGDVSALKFGFVDATNLPSPGAAHMDGLVIKFDDANHLTEAWSWKEQNKQGTETFHLARNQ